MLLLLFIACSFSLLAICCHLVNFGLILVYFDCYVNMSFSLAQYPAVLEASCGSRRFGCCFGCFGCFAFLRGAAHGGAWFVF
jgi:hypothetical protein